MKFYSVSVPVYARVVVLVQAEDEEQAQEIALRHANMNDVEAVDSDSRGADSYEVDEIKEGDLGSFPKVFGINGRVILK